MNCYKCGSNSCVKAGFVKEIQRYRCKNCGFYFTQNDKSVSADLKRIALHLYLENYSLKYIGDLLGVSDVAVHKWIRKYGNELHQLRKKGRRNEVVRVEALEQFISANDLIMNKKWMLYEFNSQYRVKCRLFT